MINLKLQKRSTYIKDLQFSCQVPATYIKANSNQTQKLQKLQHYQRNLTNSNQMQKLQHYRRNLTNMNAATHIYQRIKPQHLSNFINHSAGVQGHMANAPSRITFKHPMIPWKWWLQLKFGIKFFLLFSLEPNRG